MSAPSTIVETPEDRPISSVQPLAVRNLVIAGASMLVGASIAHSLDLYRSVGLLLFSEQFLFSMLGISYLLIFLNIDLKGKRRVGHAPLVDWAMGLAGMASCFWLAVRYPQLAHIVVEEPFEVLLTGTVILILTCEGLRRTAGGILLVVLLMFIAFGVAGQYVPGSLQGQAIGWGELISYLAFDTNSLMGVPLKVVTSIVIAFLFMGAVLQRSGGSTFFTELSVAAMGRSRGGAAKISIVASSLFGSISGSAVSNVVSTGVITIPLMRRGGYAPASAGAIEAVASTGGQLMPPVMGATAFLMAEYLYVPYSSVVLAALVPSLLYYAGLFIQADLEAAKNSIARVPEELIPRIGPVIKSGWIFILPFAVLIVSLFWLNYSAEESALFATAVLLAAGFLFGYKGKRMTLDDLFDCIARTGILVLDLMMIGAAAGLIIGILNKSGLGFALTLLLVDVGSGSILLLLILAAIVCILLGMGMPTIGVYVLVATLVAPAMVEVGITPMAAHMFVFYFGVLSFITPPICIAAFVAANLAGSPPMKTGFVAMRFGWSAFIVPFLFIVSPTLLLDGEPGAMVRDIGTALVGVWFVSAGLIGYTLRRIGMDRRLPLIVAGLLLFVPDGSVPGSEYSDILGLLLGGALVLTDFFKVRQGARNEQASL